MIPPRPPTLDPAQDAGNGKTWPRYEEVAQDGRVQIAGLVQGLTTALWMSLLSKVPAMPVLRSQGILPILHRMVVEAEEHPISIHRPIQCTGGYRFAREQGGERLFLNMWMESRAQLGATMAPKPAADAPWEVIGRVFTEQVLTKPFAKAGERKVARLLAPGVPEIPEDEHVFEPGEALLERAARSESDLEELGDHRFGMMHTDANQHVNSLVYPRVFEELLVRNLMQDARITNGPLLLARTLDIRWRKPFFAGERARVNARRVEPEKGFAVAVVGGFYGDGPKAQAAVKLQLR